LTKGKKDMYHLLRRRNLRRLWLWIFFRLAAPGAPSRFVERDENENRQDINIDSFCIGMHFTTPY
jgi:hypothetical protein